MYLEGWKVNGLKSHIAPKHVLDIEHEQLDRKMKKQDDTKFLDHHCFL